MDSNENSTTNNTSPLFSEVQEFIDFNTETGEYTVTVNDFPSDISALLTTPSEV